MPEHRLTRRRRPTSPDDYAKLVHVLAYYRQKHPTLDVDWRPRGVNSIVVIGTPKFVLPIRV